MKYAIHAWSAVLLGAMVGSAAAQTVEYIHTDALGSPVAVTDAAGNVNERYVYEPHGGTTGSGVEDGPGFTGHVSDSLTGLIYMQQRYFDPALGIFLSVDVVNPHGGALEVFNRYRYANSNPYSFIDPDGRFGCAASRISSVCGAAGSDAGIARTSVRSPIDNMAEHGAPDGVSRNQVSGQAAPVAEGEQNSWQVNGAVVGEFPIELSGMAAIGVGFQAVKGVNGADSKVGIVTPALGLNTSADTQVVKLTYNPSGAKPRPVEIGMGFSGKFHGGVGGRVSVMYVPPSKFEASLNGGIGAGGGFHVFEVNYNVKEK